MGKRSETVQPTLFESGGGPGKRLFPLSTLRWLEKAERPRRFPVPPYGGHG